MKGNNNINKLAVAGIPKSTRTDFIEFGNLLPWLPTAELSTEQFDEVKALFRRETRPPTEKFFQFRLIIDGLNFSDLIGDEVEKTIIDLPKSITSFLEIQGETSTGEFLTLAYFNIPSPTDPEPDENEFEQIVKYDGYLLIASFKFEEQKIKLCLEINRRCGESNFLDENLEVPLEKSSVLSEVLNKEIITMACLEEKQSSTSIAKIKIIGVGGGGCNAVNRMIEAGIKGIDFIAVNTDLQALEYSKAPMKIQLGSKLTRGLGAGSDPNIGRDAALEDYEKLLDVLEGSDMVFVTTGLGGGTGTGATPVIASLAIELGALTVAVVTKPFTVEGKKRMLQAEQGLAELRGCVDTIITIPNSKLKEVEEKITIMEAFQRADEVLMQAVLGISNLINIPGIINLDFADVKSVMKGMGAALMGVGRAKGEDAAVKAMKAAIDSKLLEENSIRGAKGALINITCSKDMPLDEIEKAISLIQEEVHEDSNIIFGTVFDEDLGDEVKITVIATGLDNEINTIPVSDDILKESHYSSVIPIPQEMPVFPIRNQYENFDVPTFIRRQAD